MGYVQLRHRRQSPAYPHHTCRIERKTTSITSTRAISSESPKVAGGFHNPRKHFEIHAGNVGKFPTIQTRRLPPRNAGILLNREKPPPRGCILRVDMPSVSATWLAHDSPSLIG
jgi:hypothetical protein